MITHAAAIRSKRRERRLRPVGLRHGEGEIGNREAGLGHDAALQKGQGRPFCKVPRALVVYSELLSR